MFLDRHDWHADGIFNVARMNRSTINLPLRTSMTPRIDNELLLQASLLWLLVGLLCYDDFRLRLSELLYQRLAVVQFGIDAAMLGLFGVEVLDGVGGDAGGGDGGRGGCEGASMLRQGTHGLKLKRSRLLLLGCRRQTLLFFGKLVGGGDRL